MRIKDVELIVFEYRAAGSADSHGHGHPGPEHDARGTLFHISTDAGVDGYCLGGSPTTLHLARQSIVGEDPLDRELLWQRLHDYRSSQIDGDIGVIDTALWDLAGRAADVPVFKLLGGFRDRVPAYASTMCGDDIPGGLDTPEHYADFAEQCVEQGYRAVKLHTWMPPYSADPRRDLSACAAVRERVGPDIALMVDAHHNYTRQQALYLGQGLEELGYHWYEEPMYEGSMSSYIWLQQQLHIPLVGPETIGGLFHMRAEWIVNRATDICRYSPGHGGITAMMKCVHLCEALNVGLEAHGGGHATLQVLCAMGIPGEYYELGLLHPHYDYFAYSPFLNTRIDRIDVEGCLHAPEGPGLGLDLNWDYINSHRV